ncbi:uncharacterized protein GGS22DRAFT_120835 [Annulohypoxylon maeteangense]|uniref:uncharacterized protein n=1 Tax=Annulohypoxylon maeteangense TaxID=1927788 RepID=UPI002008E059|nr:uncharacterized protein GGS22DRAFT_120835 [Annulohypoxylon maeteangense]KAI0887047.1 hypothetical protein GGS22DRAFT_120835 [Annulohypoxylon maeteangense]
MWNLFSILTEWGTAKPYYSKSMLNLSLQLSVYSPSDRDHHFRDHRFYDDNKTYYDSPRINHLDPYHGWYFGEQVIPGPGPKHRLFGRPLYFDFRYIGTRDLPSLPKVDFITSLIIPRQFYRPIPKIELIFRSLPNLEIFRYEPWYPISTDRAWLHEADLLAILDSLPPTVTRFSGYKDSNDVLNRSNGGSFAENAGSKVFSISQRLIELDLSFIIDAKSFFAPFNEDKEKDSWDNLEGLTLTSDSLRLNASPAEVDKLLRSAAEVALSMPKLQMMELWSGKRSQARIFRYTRYKDNSLVEWLETGLSFTALGPSVKRSWQMVADKYVRGHMDFETRDIHPDSIRCRGSILPYLMRRDKTLTSASLQQIMWEATELKRVRRQAPPHSVQPIMHTV